MRTSSPPTAGASRSSPRSATCWCRWNASSAPPTPEKSPTRAWPGRQAPRWDASTRTSPTGASACSAAGRSSGWTGTSHWTTPSNHWRKSWTLCPAARSAPPARSSSTQRSTCSPPCWPCWTTPATTRGSWRCWRPVAALTPRVLAGLNRPVSAIGAGCWTIGGPAVNGQVPIGWDGVNPDHAYTGLVRAHELGVTLFDTADVYGMGRSERLLGRLLRQVNRDDLVISSKVGYFAGTAEHPYHPGQIRRQLDATLTNLGTDHLDIYFFHSNDFGPADRYLDEAIAQIRHLQQKGLVRAIGMRAPHVFAEQWAHGPSPSPAALRFLTLFERIRPQVLTVRYNLLCPDYTGGETDIFDFARRHRVGVIIKQALAQGLLTGRHLPTLPRRFSGHDHRSTDPTFRPAAIAAIHKALNQIARHFGGQPADLVRLALRYALHRDPSSPVLVGFRDSTQITMNLTCLGESLTTPEINLLRCLAEPAARAIATDHADRPHTRPPTA
ncbi:aldo/keto reductase [Sphaerimonospora cavernae]|uniref:Aldo/keto reductase n=1 Tax=Sphaerimonospora cavernae TaxID=1740611 RepID=A0ABV6UDV0_9ACTN